MKDDTLYLSPGEEKNIKLTVQNKENINLTVALNVTSDIATIEKTILNISGASFNNIVYLNIKVPNNATKGDTYPVTYSMRPISTTDGQGTISLNFKISNSFTVIIGEEKIVIENDKKSYDILLIIPIIFVLIILFIIIWNRSRIFSKKLIEK